MSRLGSVRWHQAGAWLALLGMAVRCGAATVEVKVTDERGEPVQRVAVYATSTSLAVHAPVAAAANPAGSRPSAVMDQHENQFVPHLLIVQAGTEVLFPNSDVVSHHVYSFSAAKTFELGLYKGNAHPPLVFDEPGVVVLGCNIHDSMLGYILVVPTPHFTLTDERGVALIDDLAAGDYTVEAWTPRARPAGLPAARSVSVAAGGAPAALELQLKGRLAPDQDHGATSLSWERY